MTTVSDELRQQVIERAREQCEYCQTPMRIVVEIEIDHIVPQSVGGATELDNLCLACVGCNGYKLAFQEAEDPETGEIVSLYNPRIQHWHDHFAWSDDGIQVIGLTPTGRATVIRLRMNRERMVEARRLWIRAGWRPGRAI